MKIGPLLTAILGLIFGVGFFVHQFPPSTRHLVQGVIVAVPALLLMGELHLAGRARAAGGSPYRLLAVQGLAACALGAALADQHVRKGSAWWFGTFLMVVAPLLVSTFELSETSAGEQNPE